MKKKILVGISIVVCLIAVGVFMLAGHNISPGYGYYLKADNGSHIVMLDDSPVVMSLRTVRESSFDKLDSGDKIFILHDGIQETYPGGTGVYLVLKLSDGDLRNITETALCQLCEMGWLSAESIILSENNYLPVLFDTSHARSYSMFDYENIKQSSINADKMNDEEITHLPAFKFDTAGEFDAFLSGFDKEFDSGYSDATDFREKLKGFDEEYFEDKSAVLVFYKNGSGSVSYDVESVYCDGETFRIAFSINNHGEADLTVVTSNIIVVGVEKSFLGDCNYFDAVVS